MAEARLQISEANARIAGADLYPQANGIFRAGRFKRNFIGFPFGNDAAPGAGGQGQGQGQEAVLSNQNNEFGLELDMSWEIDLWGRIRRQVEAADAEQAARFLRGFFARLRHPAIYSQLLSEPNALRRLVVALGAPTAAGAAAATAQTARSVARGGVWCRTKPTSSATTAKPLPCSPA